MKAPIPLIDNFDHLKNPFRHSVTLSDAVSARVEVDLVVAQKELMLALQFIYSYRGSPDTSATYRREVERLLQWSWLVEGKSLAEIRRQHFERYVAFCQAPPNSWIGVKNVSRFVDTVGVEGRIPNKEWRPFVAKIDKRQYKNGRRANKQDFGLSASALQGLFAVCSSFFNFLGQEEYLDQNPVAQIRQKSKYLRKQAAVAPVRRLSHEQWAAVLAEIHKSADGEEDPARFERMLFIMTALFALYLRISELTESERWQPKMSDFWKDASGHWWFTTVGKGNKQRDVSVSDQMLSALIRYRLFLGLTRFPIPGDQHPLLPKSRGKGGIASTRQVRNIVQEAFDCAIQNLNTSNQNDEAESLKLATVHWLRHTGISEDVKTRPREHVRDDAGHGSSAITDRYIDVERKARNESAKNKPILSDES